MTLPQTMPVISLGNILTIGTLLVSVAAGFAVMQWQVTATLTDLDDLEKRVRVIEDRSARQSEQLTSAVQQIDRVRAELQETNALLRQLLTREGSRFP